jgi:uncharacterized protein DUF998
MLTMTRLPHVEPAGTRAPQPTLQKILLSCGVIAPVLYIVAYDVIGASLYPGYDRISRPVSELSATYAPTRAVIVSLMLVFQLLMIAFWIGVWRAVPFNRPLRITAGIMLGFIALALAAYPFPMATDEVLGANTIHTIIWGVITPLLMLFGIGVSAAAFGKRFRIYVIVTLLALVASSAATGILAAQINGGVNIGWFGVPERAIQGVWLQWVAVLAIVLLRNHYASPQTYKQADADPADSMPASGPASIT